MSQQSYHQQSADGNDINFTITTFSSDEIKVYLDGVLKTAGVHYNINPYNTNSQSTVEWIGTHPNSGVVRVVRETDVLNTGNTAVEGKATFTPGSSIKAVDLNNNQKQVLRSLQEHNDQLIQTYDIEPDAITNAKIADSQIDSEHYVDGSIDREHLANDIIDGSKIADNSIDSEHYADLSIDSVHIANSAVTSTKIADNAVTTTEILNGAVTRAKLEADIIDGTKLADNAVDSEHYTDGSIDRVHLEADIIDSTRLADDSVNSEHYVDGSIDRIHLAADIVDGTKLADDAVGAEHIQANAVTDSEIATGTLDNRYFTETELTGGALDGRYFTETESDARYFNVSTGDTIKDGDTFPDNDTTIATTAAINDRIIDLVDDVGGFVPIANELSFPNSNPDVNDGAGTLVSIKSLSQNLTSNGSGVISISNGTVGNSTVTIVGADNSTTYAAGFGLIVETHADANKYTFHRLVPKATEVTTVAGISSNITTVANNTSNINAVAADASDIGIVAADGTDIGLVAGSISNVNTTAGSIANVNTVAGSISNVNSVGSNISNVNSVASNESNINSAVSNASNINSAVSNASNINTVAGSISNVNTTAGSISNVNTVASNISSVNSFANTYRIGSTNPDTSLDVGDLFFNTSTDSLKVYTGSAWVDGVTATGDFALKTGNTFTGSNIYNDNVRAIFGTGSDLQIYHNGNHNFIADTGTGDIRIGADTNITLENAPFNEFKAKFITDGAVELYYDNSKKLETSSTGATVTGNITVSGNVDGRDVAADGTKLDGIETGATADQTASDIKTLFNSSGLVNAQIADNAGIAGTKISPNFSGQNIVNTGTLSTGNATVTHLTISGSTVPLIDFVDSDNNPDFSIRADVGSFRIKDTTNNAERFVINSDGHVDIAGNVDFGAGIDVTGDISCTGNITGTGNLNVSGDIEVDDGDSIYVGTGNDLRVFHNGTTSFIRNNNSGGILRIDNGSGNANAIFNAGGSTELYFNNSKKLETTSNGVTINNSHLLIQDSKRLYVGTGSDLGLFHNGTTSFIRSETSATLNIDHGGTGEDMAKFIPNGAVELYYDGSKKLESVTGGVTVTGDLTVTNDVIVPGSGEFYGYDNSKLVLGHGRDLQIYHNGSHSYIADTGTGNLRLIGNGNVDIMNAEATEYKARFITDGAVELYHNNARKVSTHSNGLTIKNEAGGSSSSLYVIGDEGESAEIQMNADDGDDNADYFRLIHLASDNSWRLQNYAGGAFENNIRAYGNAQVELYWDNVKKFQTEEVGANFFGRSVDCQLRLKTSDGTSRGHIYAYNDNSIAFLNAAGNYSFRANNDKTVTFFNHGLPNANNAYDLGSSSYRWANVYTNDLHLSNEGHSNDVDGTWGDWTIQEGESDLFLKNNRSGKKYKFNLMEVS